MNKIIVVTGCDTNHDPLAAELLASLQADLTRAYDIGFVRVGAAPAPDGIAAMADRRVEIGGVEPIKPGEGFLLAHEAIKARLPECFPGYDTYVWLDADTWVQNPIGLAHIVETASLADISIHSQLDPNYFTCAAPDDYTLSVYRVMFGDEDQLKFGRYPMVNTGVFGATARSPLWKAWKTALWEVRRRLAGQEVRFFSDQIPLHRLIYSGAVTMHPLRAVNNWLVLHSLPRLDWGTRLLTAPSFPYEPINILHLIGASKWQTYPLDGRQISLRYASFKALVRSRTA